MDTEEKRILLPGEAVQQENRTFDFHTHTTASDGANTPGALVKLAK